MRHLTPCHNVACLLASLLVLAAAGCTARPAWSDDPASATLAYWAERPAVTRAAADDYRALWRAADEARQRFGFEAALADYRGGMLTTEPTHSPQPFEVWRRELRTPSALAESALATVRRRIEFRFGRDGDVYFVEPRVLVERLSLGERRISNAIEYRAALGAGRQRAGQGGVAPYWYAVGRDAPLERALARRIARRADGRVKAPPAPPLPPLRPAASGARE